MAIYGKCVSSICLTYRTMEASAKGIRKRGINSSAKCQLSKCNGYIILTRWPPSPLHKYQANRPEVHDCKSSARYMLRIRPTYPGSFRYGMSRHAPERTKSLMALAKHELSIYEVSAKYTCYPRAALPV